MRTFEENMRKIYAQREKNGEITLVLFLWKMQYFLSKNFKQIGS